MRGGNSPAVHHNGSVYVAHDVTHKVSKPQHRGHLVGHAHIRPGCVVQLRAVAYCNFSFLKEKDKIQRP